MHYRLPCTVGYHRLMDWICEEVIPGFSVRGNVIDMQLRWEEFTQAGNAMHTDQLEPANTLLQAGQNGQPFGRSAMKGSTRMYVHCSWEKAGRRKDRADGGQ